MGEFGSERVKCLKLREEGWPQAVGRQTACFERRKFCLGGAECVG